MMFGAGRLGCTTGAGGMGCTVGAGVDAGGTASPGAGNASDGAGVLGGAGVLPLGVGVEPGVACAMSREAAARVNTGIRIRVVFIFSSAVF